MAIQSITFPLSDEPALARLEATVLADRMRECWYLWNQGHPFVEILDHRREGSDYQLEFETEEGVRGDWNDSIVVNLIPFIMARFIQELSIIHRGKLPDGAFSCQLQHQPSLRIILIPCPPVYRNKPVSMHAHAASTSASAGATLGDIKRLIHLAMIALGLKPDTIRYNVTDPLGQLAQTADWHAVRFDPVEIPIKQKSMELVNEQTEVWFGSAVSEQNAVWESSLFSGDSTRSDIKMQSGQSMVGAVGLNRDRQTFEPRVGSPLFQGKLMLDSRDNSTLALRKMWTNCIKGWNRDYSGTSLFRVRATLQAERMQNLRGCYPVSRVPSKEAGISPDYVAYRLLIDEEHPIYGEVRRMDGASLVDGCLEENIFQVIVNDNPDPLWTKGHKFEIMKTKDEDPNILILKSNETTNEEAPQKGWLRLDNPGTVVLQRRKERFIESALRTKVIQRILSDSDNQFSEHAVRWRVAHPDWRLESSGSLQLVQGPPGTGKTWTATRLVEDILRQRPEARILLCAKEHLALDHLTANVSVAMEAPEFKGIHVVRLMSSRRDTIQRDEHLDASITGEMAVRSVLESTQKMSKAKPFQSRLDHIEASMYQGSMKASWPEAFAEKEARIIAVTVTDRVVLQYLDELGSFDYVILEEAGKSYPSELLATLSLARNAILIGDQMQLPPFELREIKDNIRRLLELRESDLDLKDADHGLKAFIRGVKYAYWDEKDDEILADIEPWLEPFKLLFNISNERFNGDNCVMLSEERRMFESLSDLVGEVFYGSPFQWMKNQEIPDSDLPSIFKENGRLVLVDLPHCKRVGSYRESRSKGRSLCNLSEAKLAASIAERIHSDGGEVVILSPYQGQVDAIAAKLNSDIPVRTVDGYQGKEADFIILSLVRNNEKTSGRRWGFVSDPNRLNVALSRARDGLIVLVSLEHLRGSEFQEGAEHLSLAIEAMAERGSLLDISHFGGEKL